MLDYMSIFEDCKKELRDIGIPIANDENITISIDLPVGNRGEGYCHCENEQYIIYVKKAYFTCKTPDMQHMKSLIMHELVHTCPDSFFDENGFDNHPAQFIEYAKEIYDKLHLHILEFEDIHSYRAGNEPIKIMCECSNCHFREIFRSEKGIEKSSAARNTMKYGFQATYCQYCGNVHMQYKKVSS